MPIPTIPPPQQPPTIIQPNPQSQNNFNPTQGQNVNITPSTTNTTSNQSQESTGTGTGVANAYSNPNIYGVSANSNTQVNNGYGENSEECMTNVGCKTVPAVDFIAYYGKSSINNKITNDFYSGSNSDNSNYGGAIRLVVPLGNGFNGNLNKAAEAEVIKREAENYLLQQRLMAERIALDDIVIRNCVNLKNTVNGKSIVIDAENASPVIARVDELCRGLNIAIASAPVKVVDNSLLEENRRLREKIEQLTRTGIPQKVGN